MQPYLKPRAGVPGEPPRNRDGNGAGTPELSGHGESAGPHRV